MLCIIDGPRSQNSGSRSELRINMSAQFHLLSASRGLNPQGHAVYFHKHFLFFFLFSFLHPLPPPLSAATFCADCGRVYCK